ncbi:recombinase family protein [Clostridium cagae]|uniref:recombinase family protein n=1 Tax=Clostridium cagae TaxID=2080751 RepID=UPI003F7771F8
MEIAIYSRKSVFTGKGESIENQIELCKEYCTLHYKDENIEYTIYEDEGFSGKNLNRPKFKELINEIKRSKYDVLICYRLDRISRNVADFSSTLELLQKYNTHFVSIKEQFDTSTPMGRAMIYIASVFAQLERETIAERVKDNMLQLAKMGKWSGGQLPLGFKSEKVTYVNEEMKEKSYSKLIPIDSELNVIRFIFKKYLLKNSIREVTKELNLNNFKSKNNGNFDLTQVKRILRNPLYVKSNKITHKYLNSINYNVYGIPNGNGYLTYNKKTHKDNLIVSVAAHKGIIDAPYWIQVQKILDNNKEKIASRSGTGNNNALFSGLLKCGKCGSNMVIKYNTKNKNGHNYIYYICSNKHNKFGISKCDCPNLNVDLIDDKIVKKLQTYNKDIILESYNNHIRELQNQDDSILNNNLKYQINFKETQVKNLINQLSNTTNELASNLLMEQINSITNEISSLKENLKNNIDNLSYIKDQINNLKLSKNSFYNFDINFNNTNDIDIKRNLIRSIIKNIIFDPDKNDLNINFFGSKNMCFDNTSKPLDCNLYPSKRRCNCRFT